MRSLARRSLPHRSSALSLALAMLGAGVGAGAVAARKVDCCARIAGSYVDAIVAVRIATP